MMRSTRSWLRSRAKRTRTWDRDQGMREIDRTDSHSAEHPKGIRNRGGPRCAGQVYHKRSAGMQWITHERVKKFVDTDAEFHGVPSDQVMDQVQRLGATPFDIKGGELGHHGQACSCEAILERYDLTGYAALVLPGNIVNGADTDNTLLQQPDGAGIEAG